MTNKKTKSAFRHIKNFTALMLCLMLITALLPFSVFAKNDKNSKVVRVGWFDSTYNIMDASGRRSGYCYEYERKIAAYTDWEYEYVDGSWVKLLQMLENNETDMPGGATFTEERADKILFPSYAMGTQSYCR